MFALLEQLTILSMNINPTYLHVILEDDSQNEEKTTISKHNALPVCIASPDRTLNQQFHVAALSGNLHSLQELYTRAHLPIDCRDKENSTALFLSSARGHYSCVEYLLKNGADPNARRLTGASSLSFAASYRHTRIVELLLNQYKANVDLSTLDGSTPLHVACERGFLDIVEVLLATGTCDLSVQRLDGVTALSLVVQHGHEFSFDCLLERLDQSHETLDLTRKDGAKPNLELLKNGESCLHAVTMFNDSSVVRALLDHGANPFLNNGEG